jgi:pyruvate dehydrogenase E2 component (dihydrolipoamide acetyltransferase)
LTQRQLQGGTFPVTNLGMFDIDSFTPLINLPHAAILGVGRIVQEPVVRAGRIEIGQTMSLSLTFDHRVIDGAPAARWLKRLTELIRSPDRFVI